MTVRYVGPGGLDTNNGLTWATRKLTLNGVEDSPVTPGDLIHVAPGVYREQLITDVDGTSGSPIVYEADVTGAYTDGVGGVVRLTGSNDDLVGLRASCINNNRDYRTYRGFRIDGVLGDYSAAIQLGGANLIIEDCVFNVVGANLRAIQYANVPGTGNINVTIRRCFFLHGSNADGVLMYGLNPGALTAGVLVENCIFLGRGIGIALNYIGGFKVRNCVFLNASYGVSVQTGVGTNTVEVYNCLFSVGSTGVNANAANVLIEDYNNFSGCFTDRGNVAVGANSTTRLILYDLPALLQGMKFPTPMIGALSQWSQLAGVGAEICSEDIFGLTRPAAAKNTKGATQHLSIERATNTVHGTSETSVKLADMGRHQIIVPHSGQEVTYSIWVYREADYAGTLPQLVVKQPGQANQTDTDTGSAGQWNQLSITLTPAALPEYVVLELVSDNTATSGSYAVYFGDLEQS